MEQERADYLLLHTTYAAKQAARSDLDNRDFEVGDYQGAFWLKAAEGYTPEIKNFEGWVHTVTMNTRRDMIRGRQRKAVVRCTGTGEVDGCAPHDLQAQVEARELLKRLRLFFSDKDWAILSGYMEMGSLGGAVEGVARRTSWAMARPVVHKAREVLEAFA